MLFLVLIGFVLSVPGAASTFGTLKRAEESLEATQLLADFIGDLEIFYPDCVVTIAHDYGVLPVPLQQIIANRSSNNGGISITGYVHQDEVVTEASVNASYVIEYWFSWLHRESTVHMSNCALHFILFHGSNFADLMLQLAAQVLLNTHRNHFILWSPDADMEAVLLSPQARIIRLKLGVTPDDSLNRFKLQTICFFCASGYPQLLHLGQYSEDGLEVQGGSLFPDTTKDLHGQMQKNVYIEEFTKEYLKEKHRDAKPVFVTEAVLEMLGEFMNFDWYVATLPSGDQAAVETQRDDGTWAGYVGELLYERADMGAGTLLFSEVTAIADYPPPYYHDHLTFFTRNPRPAYSWKVLFQPYTMLMWGLVFSACFICSVFFWILLNRIRRFKNPFRLKQPRHLYVYSLVYMLLPLIEENPPTVPSAHAARIFLALWWLFAMVICCGYTSKLIGFLAYPELEKLPQTIDDIVTNGWTWGALNIHAVFFLTLVEHEENPNYHKFANEMGMTSTIEECMEYALVENYGCISLRIFLVLWSYQYVGKDGSNPFMKAEEKSITVQAGIAMPKHNVLSERVAWFSEQIWDSGLLRKFEHDLIYYSRFQGVINARKNNVDRSLSIALNVRQLQGALYLLAFGCLISGVVLFVEGFMKQKNNILQRKRKFK